MYGYNLLHYSVYNLIDMAVVSWMVYGQTKQNIVWIIGLVPAFLAFLFFFFFKYSTVSVLGLPDLYPQVGPIDVHQYFDFCCFCSLIVILLAFYWLNEEVNSKRESYVLNVKSIICILSLLTFHGGAFFTMAFARLALPESNVWTEMWSMIYFPLYYLFLLGLTIGALWKKAQ